MCSGNSDYENVTWLIPYILTVTLLNVSIGALKMCCGPIRNNSQIVFDDDKYDNRADFAPEETDHEEDLERRQMLDSSVDQHMIKDYLEEQEERDELKRFLHHQQTHHKTRNAAAAGILTVGLLCIALLVNDTPHNYLEQDEVSVEGIPGLDINHLECNDPCEFPHVRSIFGIAPCLHTY
eukprot:COSAG02_NODE_2007_length_10128_cov_5.313989_10_plen_180_part_00